MDWDFIPGFVPNIQPIFRQEVENEEPTTRASGEAEYQDVVIPYAAEPFASQQFIEEYNRKRATTKRIRANRTMPQKMSWSKAY